MSFNAIGNIYTNFSETGRLARLLSNLDMSWCKGVCLHNTYDPTLDQRPVGWTEQHMRNLAHYYGQELGWSAGPHLFVDGSKAMGLTPLEEHGVHAVSYNRTHIGIEVLGNYDNEDPNTGRGLECWSVAAALTACILSALKLPSTEDHIKFHRDDPKTEKTCPGAKVDKSNFISMVNFYLISAQQPYDIGKLPDHVTPDSTKNEMRVTEMKDRIAAIEWQLKQIKKIL